LKHTLTENTKHWLPTWEQVINNLNMCHPDTCVFLENDGVICHDVMHDDYWPVHELAQEIANNHNDEPITIHTYISFKEDSKTFGKHKDDIDVYFLNAIGQTQFIVWEDDTEYEYHLEPGDLLYIPAGLYHSTSPITPRVGLSYGIE